LPKQVLVGIEDNKPEAAAALQAAAKALAHPSLEVVVVPTRYPAGGAKQLIRVLTGIEVPHGSRSTDYGVQCFNVATALAVWRALEQGRTADPSHRHGGRQRRATAQFRCRHRHADRSSVRRGGPQARYRQTHHGRPDDGHSAAEHRGAGGQGHELPAGVIAGAVPAARAEMPCIRCGECARACPADLQPFELYWHSRARNFGRAQEYHLFDCIECGCCAYVCPSHIPLVDYYRYAKSEIWAREREKDAADSARERFEFRNWRAEREKEEKAANWPRAAQPNLPPLRTGCSRHDSARASAATTDDPKKALIEAALARAKAQKEAVEAKNTETLTAAQQAQIDAAEARRRRAAELADSGKTE
jgi:electron transport complex protein RnfC